MIEPPVVDGTAGLILAVRSQTVSDRRASAVVGVLAALATGAAVPIIPSTVWPVTVALGFLVLGLVVSRRLYGSVASPLGLFAVAWEGGIALACLRLVDYLPISLSGYALLHGSFAAIVVAALVVGPALQDRSLPRAWPSLGWLLIVLGGLGVALGLQRLDSSLGILAVVTNPDQLRLAKIESGFDAGLAADLRLLLLAAALLVPPKSRPGYVLMGIAATWSLLSSDRSFVLLVGLFFGVAWLFRRGPRLHWRDVVLPVVLLAICLSVFVKGGELLGRESLTASLVESGTSHQTALPSWLLAPYVYVTGGFVAFAQYADQERPAKSGIEAVVTPMARLIGEKENIFYEFRGVPFDFNLYTYLRSWYDAAGIAGTLAGPALYGFFAALAYTRRSKSLGWFWSACVLTVGLIGGIFNPYLTYISFLALLAAGWLLSYFVVAVHALRDSSSVPYRARHG